MVKVRRKTETMKRRRRKRQNKKKNEMWRRLLQFL